MELTASDQLREIGILRLREPVIPDVCVLVYPAKCETRRSAMAALYGRRRSGVYISPAFGEHPIHIPSELVAYRLAGKIEKSVDFVPVDLDTQGSTTRHGISPTKSVELVGQISVTLSLMSVKMPSPRQKETQKSCMHYPIARQSCPKETPKLGRHGSTNDIVWHILTTTEELHPTRPICIRWDSTSSLIFAIILRSPRGTRIPVYT